MPTDDRTIDAYNKNAENWLKGKNTGHTYLEKPAMYSKLPDLKGKTVLCVGCGAGEECQHIKSLGAKKVVGMDISATLIEKAKKDYPEIEFYVMDMENINFSESLFDFVYSSLVMHYVKDWTKVLSEIKRIMKENGIFLFSTNDPVYWSTEIVYNKEVNANLLGCSKDKNGFKVYGNGLDVRKIEDIWFGNFKVVYYNKPFSLMIKEILKSGFKILDCIEPKPLEAMKEIDPEFWQKCSKIPFFIIFELKK